jgi:hypothetical protein
VSHLILASHYDFYKMPEDERKKLIGRVFKERDWKKPKLIRDGFYFVVDLASDQFNYGMPQGLICLTGIVELRTGKHFNVVACSPDDLDEQVTFSDGDIKYHDRVFRYLKGMPKKNVRYRDVMQKIQRHFGTGFLYP